jgi:putative ABC transport system permease protein
VIPLSYNIRNLAVRKTTSAAAGIGLALVVFVVAGVLMLSNGIRKTLGRAADPDVAVVLRKGADVELASSIEEPNIGLVTATPGVAHRPDGTPDSAAELLVVVLLDKLGTNGFSNVQVRGVPEDVLKFRRHTHVVEGRAPHAGTDEVMVGRSIRGRFKGVDVGQSFDLKKNRPVTVVGVFEDQGSSFESEVWADLNTVRTGFGRDGLVSAVRVRLEGPSKFDAFKTALEQNRQLNLEATRESDYYEKQSSGITIFISGLGFVIAFFFGIGAIIGAMITMYAAVSSRQREIGTLRALGFSKTSIVMSFLAESVVLAVAGGVVGAAFAMGLAFVKFSMMNYASWSEIVIGFEPSVRSMVTAIVVAGLMGLLGGLFPAVRAARMNPVVAMRA